MLWKYSCYLHISKAALQNFPYENLIQTILQTKVPQEIYRTAYMLKCDFNRITSTWVFSSKFAEFFRTPVHKKTSGGLLSNILQTLFYKFSNVTLSMINLEAFFAIKLWTFVTEISCFLFFIFFWLIFLVTTFHTSIPFGELTY